MNYYIIDYADGSYSRGEFECYLDALNYAESYIGQGLAFTINEFTSKDDYLNGLEIREDCFFRC